VLQVFKEPDILIADDDDVSRLKPGTVLEVNIKNFSGTNRRSRDCRRRRDDCYLRSS